MNLYEIDYAIERILDGAAIIDQETGEIVYDFSSLESLKSDLSGKLDNIACYVKNLTAEAEAIKAEEERLKERRQAKERKAESLKKYVSEFMLSRDLMKHETARSSLSFRKSEQVQVDIDHLDAKYTTAETIIKANKAEIKKAIKAGENVQGAELVTIQNLQIK